MEIDTKQLATERLVHTVCQQMRHGINSDGTTTCELCPAVLQTPCGPGTQGCYRRALQVIELIRAADQLPPERPGGDNSPLLAGV